MLRGHFDVEIIRDGNVISRQAVDNAITDEGLNSILEAMFRSGTVHATWYIGLVDNASFSAFAAADVMSSHAGWIELTAYDEAVRQTWGVGAASGRAITNAAAATFTISATKTVYGFFVTSVNTKSGTTGVLWSEVALASPVPVVDNDLVKITYTVSG